MESNKYNKLGNVTTKKEADSPDIENTLVVTRGERRKEVQYRERGAGGANG